MATCPFHSYVHSLPQSALLPPWPGTACLPWVVWALGRAEAVGGIPAASGVGRDDGKVAADSES